MNRGRHLEVWWEVVEDNMETQKAVLWIVIGVLLVAVIYTVFFQGSATGNSVSNDKLDTTGWTENEIMNYEMHGTIPTRLAGSASSSSGSGMVGGC